MIERLRALWAKVPHDKRLHLLAGAVIALLVGVFTEPALGLIAGIVAGVGKEVYDYRRPDKGTAEWADLGATFIGAWAATMLLLVADLAGMGPPPLPV